MKVEIASCWLLLDYESISYRGSAERQAELLAGLHQTEHAIARLPTIAAHGAAVISFA
jgi:hypothetical protein